MPNTSYLSGSSEVYWGEATGLAKGDIGMGRISSRIGFLLAMLGLVGAGISGAAAQSDQEKSLYDAAKKEGKLTWYTAQFDQALATKIGNTFTQKYPGVQVNVIKATAQVAFHRLLQDIKAGQIQSDVYSTTDMSQFVYLKEKGELVKYMMPEAEKKIVPAFQNIDPEGYYHVTASGLVAITDNKEKVKEADAPKNWTDLTDPKWAGQVAIGDPNYSGMVGVWTVAMAKLYGWDFFTRLNAVKPLIGRSIDDTVTMLNAGERMVAAGDPASTLRSEEHTSELQSPDHLVCRLLLEKKKKTTQNTIQVHHRDSPDIKDKVKVRVRNRRSYGRY